MRAYADAHLIAEHANAAILSTTAETATERRTYAELAEQLGAELLRRLASLRDALSDANSAAAFRRTR